jgi:hypothetical protein
MLTISFFKGEVCLRHFFRCFLGPGNGGKGSTKKSSFDMIRDSHSLHQHQFINVSRINITSSIVVTHLI